MIYYNCLVIPAECTRCYRSLCNVDWIRLSEFIIPDVSDFNICHDNEPTAQSKMILRRYRPNNGRRALLAKQTLYEQNDQRDD